MQELLVQIPGVPAFQYPIFFGDKLHEKLSEILQFSKYSKVAALFDGNVLSLWKDKLYLSGVTILDGVGVGEGQKTSDNLEKLWTQYQRAGLDRKSLVLHLGGGATIDVASLASSTFMRGISFVNIPTTLLSQVDSSIGGKNGINFGGIKNLVGTFAQPQAVVIDPSFLKTLSEREFNSGFGEVIKHALISDRKFFDRLQQGISSPDDLLPLIRHSCSLKAEVVAQDPLEAGLRKILNFGHTVGHAIESVSHETNAPLLHGESISVGMIAESWIALQLNMISFEEFEKIRDILGMYRLPTNAPGLNLDKLMNAIRSDKKNQGASIQCALIRSIGSCEHGITVTEDLVRSAFQEVS